MITNTHEDATLIRPEDKAYLIPKHLTTKNDLDAWEKRNIVNAKRWASNQNKILSIAFIKTLHNRMFSQLPRLKRRSLTAHVDQLESET